MDIMLDLETLGTGDHAPIIQIGAVRFDPNTEFGYESESRYVRNITWGCDGFGEIDPDTVLWWNKQKADTRNAVFDQTGALPLRIALTEFFAWAHRMPVGGIWANSPDFDLRLLRQACSRVPYMPYTFDFRDHRDMRTLVREVGVAEDEPVMFIGSEHNALDDALHQALWVTNIKKRVNGAQTIIE